MALASLVLAFSVAAVPALAEPTGSTRAKPAPERRSRVRPARSDAGGESTDRIGRFTSKHFELHTDLSREAAQELLERLETMLGLISKYWGQPSAGVIEMYVVEDLAKWPPGSINPEGLSHIEAGAGVTLGKTRTDGRRFVSKAIVYAVADRGTPQHEAVHAYCIHTFGRVGPVWYAEGMAEMGQYWRGESRAVHAHPGVIAYLRRAEPVELGDIVRGDQKSGDSWQNYAWRWALCHLLANNPNYSNRFRPLGISLLSGQPTSFDNVYGGMQDEVKFEYELFLKQLTPGLRVDLTAWDWKAKFKAPPTDKQVKVRVEARRGWQASKVLVTAGEALQYETEGEWTVDESADPVTADGGTNGTGRLEGVLLKSESGGYQLGAPFPLGRAGELVPTNSGRLFLRCRDDWGALEDNSGAVTVRLKQSARRPSAVVADPPVPLIPAPPAPGLE